MPGEPLLAAVLRKPGAAKPDPILVGNGIRRSFGGLVAVDVEHIEVQRGAITALIGPNGAGKTTLFNLLTGFDRADAGSWRFNDREVAKLRAYRVAQLGMVRTFQLTRALSRMTVLDNMRLAASGQRGESFFAGMVRPSWRRQEADITRRADELLARFRLSQMRDEFAGSLSGGQRKLLEMARALMTEPELLMLDEPMAGVNPALTQSLLAHIKGLPDAGLTVLFVEHDMDMVRNVAHWVIVMGQGRVIAEGPPDHVMRDPNVIDAYLGAHHNQPLSDGGAVLTEDMTPADALLVADGVRAGYLPGVDILNGCSCYAGRGELVGIIGPNGAGKSTLLKAMFGLVRVRSGAVHLDGGDITNMRADKLVAQGVGFVPQSNNVFGSLTIEENLQMGAYQEPGAFAERFESVAGIFPALRERRKQRAGSLSGGERQMVAMSRALMMQPSVLLLDEPSAGLSPQMQDEVFVRVKAINATGVTVLIVEQNARRCLQIVDRAYVLEQGRNAYTGTGRQLANDPKVVELYLGTLAKA